MARASFTLLRVCKSGRGGGASWHGGHGEGALGSRKSSSSWRAPPSTCLNTSCPSLRSPKYALSCYPAHRGPGLTAFPHICPPFSLQPSGTSTTATLRRQRHRGSTHKTESFSMESSSRRTPCYAAASTHPAAPAVSSPHARVDLLQSSLSEVGVLIPLLSQLRTRGGGGADWEAVGLAKSAKRASPSACNRWEGSTASSVEAGDTRFGLQQHSLKATGRAQKQLCRQPASAQAASQHTPQ